MMKISGQPHRLVLFALVSLLAACSASVQRPPAAPPSVATDLETLRRLDAGWANMYAEQDSVYALQLLSDDFIITTYEGGVNGKPFVEVVQDRASALKAVRPLHFISVYYFRTRDTQIRLHGDAAVITGVVEEINPIRRVTGRYTATYVRGGPLGWRLVAVHMVPIFIEER